MKPFVSIFYKKDDNENKYYTRCYAEPLYGTNHTEIETAYIDPHLIDVGIALLIKVQHDGTTCNHILTWVLRCELSVCLLLWCCDDISLILCIRRKNIQADTLSHLLHPHLRHNCFPNIQRQDCCHHRLWQMYNQYSTYCVLHFPAWTGN